MDTGQEPSGVSVTPPEKVTGAKDTIINNVVGLRALVFVVLKNANGQKWADIAISSDDANQTTISALAKKRIAQSQTCGYLGYQISSPMMHLTSGELVRLLTSDAYWPLFKKYFKASKQVVTLKLEEIGIIRNSLAHFRPLTTNDVEVVKQNANQVLSVAEQTLAIIIGGGQRVPTNTKDQWYLDLRSLGGQSCQMIHSQSPNEEWVRISLQFGSPIINMYPEKPDKYVSYSVLTVNPVGILKGFDRLREFVTCVIEYVPWITMKNDSTPIIGKHVNFTFGIETLQKNHKELKADLEALLAQIDSEADLIKDDNLARGKVIYMASVAGSKIESPQYHYWNFNLDTLRYQLEEDDPPEYWGSIDMYTDHFVSDAHRFPWMPVSVSQQRFPI